MARMGGRPGPTLTDQIVLKSPYGVLKTTFGDVKNGEVGTIVSALGEEPLQVKFDKFPVAVTVPAHWAGTVVR